MLQFSYIMEAKASIDLHGFFLAIKQWLVLIEGGSAREAAVDLDQS